MGCVAGGGGGGGGGREKTPPPVSSLTSANLRIRLQIFLTFSSKPFTTMLKNFMFVPSASTKLLY